MAEGGGLQQDDKLTCSICFEVFKTPKLLPCFHTFCVACLETFVEKNQRYNKFACPLCRTSIDVPKNGVKGFQTNFYIETAKVPATGAVIPCDLCGPKSKAVQRCTDCEENLCTTCADVHMKLKATRHHKMIELSSAEAGTVRKLLSRVFCSLHPQEEVKLFCKKCDALICMVCKMTSHENHSTNDVTSEGKKMRENLKSLLQAEVTDGRLQELGDVIKRKRGEERKVEASLSNGVEAVRKQEDLLCKTIKQVAQEKVTELQTIFGRYQSEIRKEREECEREQKSAAAMRDTIQLVLDHDSDVELLKNGKEIHEKLQKFHFKETELTANVHDNYFIPGKMDKKALESMIGTVGDLENAQKVRLKDRPRKPQRPEKIKLLRSITLQDMENCWITSIAPIGNGKAWICSINSTKVKLVSLEGRVEDTVDIQARGYDITTTSSMDVLVSCIHEKAIKSVKAGNKVETILSNMDMYPRGITCSTYGREELFIACVNQRYVGSNAKGQIIKMVPGQIKYESCTFEDCKVPNSIASEDRTGLICTADWFNAVVTRVVNVYKRTGEKLATYTDANFKPCNVRFYDQDRIIVVNYCKDIRVIKTDGSLENILVKDENCRSACIDEDYNLWVGYKGKLQIYHIG